MKPTRRLAELIDSYLDQRLDEVGRFELESILLDDAAGRREFWRRAEMEGLLREWGRAQVGVNDAACEAPELPRAAGWRSHWRVAATGIAAALALAAAFWSHHDKLTGLNDALARQLQHDARLAAADRALPDHWLVTSKRQNEQADLQVRYTFDDIHPDLLRVPNQAAHSGGGLDGTIGGGAIRQGRWSYKKALEFDHRFDGVRLSVPGTYETLTMAAWIQVHAYDHLFSGLFMSDGIKPGGFHWQIMDTGALHIGITDAVPGYTSYTSPPVLTPDTFGSWQHVAVVLDLPRNRVSHYCNGGLVSRHELQQPMTVHLRSAMLGNWDALDDKDGDMIRNFRGRMDDFSIYQNALSDQEIQDLYQQGRP
ncbi:MAG: LamG domain-containing protein [Verrucomicrobiota bacterium]